MKPVKTYAGNKPNYVTEADGSLTINGEAKMSIRNFGMTGKTYKTASEAFKDADYATAIQRPESGEYYHLWAIAWVLGALGLLVFVSSRF
jgi:hypothetical protein